MIMKNNYCLYRHLKPSGEVFYIGMGNLRRPHTKSDRSDFWWKVVNKYGYEIEILKTNLSKEEAYELEIILISWYGRKNLNLGPLVNLTDGGDGSNNVVVSEQTKLKLSKIQKGRKRTDETKRKMSEKAKLRIFSKETRLKMSESAKNKIITEEHKEKLYSNKKGYNNGMFGKTHSDETKEKIRLKALERSSNKKY